MVVLKTGASEGTEIPELGDSSGTPNMIVRGIGTGGSYVLRGVVIVKKFCKGAQDTPTLIGGGIAT